MRVGARAKAQASYSRIGFRLVASLRVLLRIANILIASNEQRVRASRLNYTHTNQSQFNIKCFQSSPKAKKMSLRAVGE